MDVEETGTIIFRCSLVLHLHGIDFEVEIRRYSGNQIPSRNILCFCKLFHLVGEILSDQRFVLRVVCNR